MLFKELIESAQGKTKEWLQYHASFTPGNIPEKEVSEVVSTLIEENGNLREALWNKVKC